MATNPNIQPWLIFNLADTISRSQVAVHYLSISMEKHDNVNLYKKQEAAILLNLGGPDWSMELENCSASMVVNNVSGLVVGGSKKIT